jgi:ATP:ADP antiporter, AAA family
MHNGAPLQPSSAWLARALRVEPAERTALVWAFAYFFLLLAGYYVLRPVRTEMAVQTGVKNLPWLFTATCFMADIFRPGQGKRFFAAISAGGSLGAIADAAIPAFGAQWLGIDNMMLISAILLSACILCIARLRHWAAIHTSASSTNASQDAALGDGVLTGIKALGATGTLLAFTVVPVAFGWAIIGWLLARQHTTMIATAPPRHGP